MPDIITATSAGAIAATVLAQARTLAEFAQRVDEIEDDVLAWTHAEHVFGKQAWLAALDGTALGREIHQEITEGTRPPFPLTPATVLAGGDVVPPAGESNRRQRRQARRARRRRQRHIAAPRRRRRSSASPGCAGSCARAAARSSTSTPWPTRCATAASEGIRPVDPALVAPAGPAAAPGGDRAAGRHPALRHRGRDDRRVRRAHPGPGHGRRPGRPGRRRDRLGQRAHGLSPPPHGRRRLRRRRGDRDRPRARRGGAGGDADLRRRRGAAPARPRRARLRGGTRSATSACAPWA